MHQRIGIFGGSFNPIHNGHIHLIQAARAALHLDRVILVPAYCSPFKQAHPEMAPAEDRLAMCRIVAEKIPYCSVSDIEIQAAGVSYTVETLRAFHRLFPNDTLVLLLGSDAFLSLDRWYQWREILSLAEIGVVARDFDTDVLLANRQHELAAFGKISLCRTEIFPLSSTEIREKLKNPVLASCEVPGKVIEYIRAHHLYPAPKTNSKPWKKGESFMAENTEFDRVVAEYRDYLASHLSEKRFRHSLGVAKASRELAEQYGGVSPEKAYFAGLVHDIAKEEPRDMQQHYAETSEMDVCDAEKSAWKVWHAIAGAEILREKWGVTDPDVLNAVRYHTVARGGMSTLEKIVYLADVIEENRIYDGVETARAESRKSLEAGILVTLQRTLEKLIAKAAPIPHHSMDAYHDCIAALSPQKGSV